MISTKERSMARFAFQILVDSIYIGGVLLVTFVTEWVFNVERLFSSISYRLHYISFRGSLVAFYDITVQFQQCVVAAAL